MTPAARIQTAAELLDDILAGTPAEKALTGWARRSRFAGSKDRAAVRDHVFQALRCRRSYAALGGVQTGRGLMIGFLRAAGVAPEEMFTGQGHAPAPLSPAETSAGRTPSGQGEAYDLPDWLLAELRDSLGDRLEDTGRALQSRAPVMLRVNLAKATVAEAQQSLAREGVTATPHPICDTALQVGEGARKLAQTTAYLDGLVELQDGSSQAAMASLELPANARVLDYCAGGGGKVLALAGRGPGTWFAHDGAPGRMADLPARARRAGANVTCLDAAGCTAKAPYALVLCDAPCSGSGTWRRTPDAKWRLTPERLSELAALQLDILSTASQLVAAGGRLVYATCSILNCENEDLVARFVADHAGWSIAQQQRWPVSDGGDGFFLASLERY